MNAAYLFVKNANTTGTELLEIAYGSGTDIFTSLKWGEFCLLPLKASTSQLYFRASAGSIAVIFVAAEG